jgi:hypothetical protein
MLSAARDHRVHAETHDECQHDGSRQGIRATDHPDVVAQGLPPLSSGGRPITLRSD